MVTVQKNITMARTKSTRTMRDASLPAWQSTATEPWIEYRTLRIRGGKGHKVKVRIKMEHLPKKILSTIASYADNTSRVILATALTAPSSSWEKNWKKTPSRASKIVMSAPYYRRCWSIATGDYSIRYEEKWERLSMGQSYAYE